MSHTQKNMLCYAAYLAGGVLLTIVGADLWNVHPLVAGVAASATTLCFMLAHIVVDTRHIARRAMAQAGRRRAELIALGKYVSRIEQRMTQTATAAAIVTAPVPAPAIEPPAPAFAADNLLRFAARVSAHCTSESDVADVVQDAPGTAMQTLVAEAISNARVDLHLQPIVKLPSRQTAHYEAMPRIRDRAGQIILPEIFQPAAAAAGLAAELETQQLAGVISLCNRIGGRHPGTRIFCNLSAHALQSDRFRAELTGFMEKHAELARRLVFEMHARTALELNAEAVADLRGLESIGFAFSVDGTSLAELGKVFSVFGRLSFAKIDAAGLIAADPNVIAALARAGTQLIATRVEAERDVVEMNDLGIGFGQGDLLGKVRPAKSDGEQLRRAA